MKYKKPSLLLKVKGDASDIESDNSDKITERNVDSFPKQYLFLERYGDTIATNFNKGLPLILKHASDFYNKNVNIIESPYPYKSFVWREDDTSIYFTSTKVDQLAFKSTMNEVVVPSDYTMKKEYIENKYPQIMELLLFRQVIINNTNEKSLMALIHYIGYNYYWKAFTIFFRRFSPDPNIVEYTLSHMSNRFQLKRLGSVSKLIEYGMLTSFDRYFDDIVNDASDFILFYVADRIFNKFKSYIRSFAVKLYEDVENKNRIFVSNDFTSEGKQREDNSKLGVASGLADLHTTAFLSKAISEKWINVIAQKNKIGKVELRSTLNMILKDKSKYEELRKFFQCIFHLFIVTYNHSGDEVHQGKFIVEMLEIYKKGNTRDEDIIAIKKYLDSWLRISSKVYRTSNRTETINKFRKSVYEYFIYTIAAKS